ncbi:MAG: LTA synthase family protein [Clostridiales bacterium]|nr:LTA synthase family protein [Clostridiales bacterium]
MRKKQREPEAASRLPLPRRRRGLAVLGAAWMLLSYCCVEWYAALWLEPESAAAAHMFGFLWAVALTGVSLALPRWIGKVVYGLSFYFFAIFAAVQSGYYAVFGRMMWLGDLRYAGEGGAFMHDVLRGFSTEWWIATVALMVLGCAGCFLVPRGARPGRLRAACLMAALAAAVGLFAYPQAMFRADANGWGYQSEYRRAMSREGAYTTLYDAHKLYEVCGIYQTTVKDLWEHNLYPKTPMYRRQVMHRAAELEEWFQSRPAHEDNEMTGLFEGKNVVLVLMESMDDWLVNEMDTPAIYRLMNEGINFTNFYTADFGSVRTFNSEFCANTGMYLPTNGQYAFDYCTNDFSESLPSRFRALGYSTQAFHYNDVTFYNRGVMEPAMGYEAYNCYKNFGMVGDALLSDTGLFENEALMQKFYGGESGKAEDYTGFFNFIISRSAHMTYTYDEELSRFALGQYPWYQGSSGHEEVDCLRAKARCCDDLFAYLLRSLAESGHLEDTVIVGVADHYAYGMQDQQRLMEESGVSEPLLREKTPCFIWSYGGPDVTVDKTLNTSDLLPTLINLFGLDSDYHYLGRDAFDESYPGYAIFQERSWITASGAYEDGRVIAAFTDEGPVDEEIEAMNDLTDTYLRMNNLLLESDYYGRRNAGA